MTAPGLDYFVDHARKELHRSRRYGRHFSIVVVALDDGEALRGEPGREGPAVATAGLAAALSRAVRDADVLARVSEGEHRVLLPETDHLGALTFQRRVSEELGREEALRAVHARCPVRLSMGAATFPRDGGDLDALLATCRERQGERRSSLLGAFGPGCRTLDLRPLSFWDLADAVLDGAPIPPGSPSVKLPLDPELLDAVQREAALELGRDPSARGFVYAARPAAAGGLWAWPRPEVPAPPRRSASRVFVLGPRAAVEGRRAEHPHVTRVAVDGDERFGAHAFLLFLSETAAYALLQRPDGRLFHSSDEPLVDALVAKLQAQYDLRAEPVAIPLARERDGAQPDSVGQRSKQPLAEGEALARLEQDLRRADRARAAASSDDITGNLAQIPLVDLLQVLAVNRKTGRLEIARQDARAEIALVEGRVVDASAGAAWGEKALFRLLSYREGRFTFAAGEAKRPGRIDRRLEELLMEGLRQSDELARLLPSSPAPADVVGLAVAPAAIPQGLDALTAEVLSLLAPPRTVQDVLDRASATDLDVLRALSALLQAGHARRESRPAPGAVGAAALLGPRELDALRRRMGSAGPSGTAATGKIVLAGGGPLARRAALVRLARLPGFTARADGAQVEFGTLGCLAVEDGLRIDLVALPSDPGLAPLWRPFSAGSLGVLVLPPADGIAAQLAALAGRLPVGICASGGDAVQPAVQGGAGYSAMGSDPAEALRRLLAQACRPPAPGA